MFDNGDLCFRTLISNRVSDNYPTISHWVWAELLFGAAITFLLQQRAPSLKEFFRDLPFDHEGMKAHVRLPRRCIEIILKNIFSFRIRNMSRQTV